MKPIGFVQLGLLFSLFLNSQLSNSQESPPPPPPPPEIRKSSSTTFRYSEDGKLAPNGIIRRNPELGENMNEFPLMLMKEEIFLDPKNWAGGSYRVNLPIEDLERLSRGFGEFWEDMDKAKPLFKFDQKNVTAKSVGNKGKCLELTYPSPSAPNSLDSTIIKLDLSTVLSGQG